MRANKSFTPEEDAFIRTNYLAMDLGDIANHLGRSKSGVVHRAQRLGVKRRSLRRWIKTEDQFIRDNQSKGLGWVAGQLGRSISVTSERARQLGLSFRRTAQWQKQSRGYRQIRTQRDGERTTTWEHIEIMEQHLGRKLCKPECVHHINTIKTDNGIDNLYLCRNKQHHKLVHTSFERLLPELLRLGIVKFDRERGVYELCETSS